MSAGNDSGRISPLLLSFVLFLLAPLQLSAQIKILPPQNEELFTEDLETEEALRAKEKKKVLQTDEALTGQVDFQAPEVSYEKESTVVTGSGGVIVSGNGIQAQADQGSLNTTTQDVTLSGSVVITDSQGVVRADTASFNMEGETGSFDSANFVMEDSDFKVDALQMSKVAEDQYELTDSSFTSCHCADGYTPWKIESGKCSVTKEGYAHSYGTGVNLFGVPVLYTPYLGFPVKTERSSGLLVPNFGYSDRHGFIFDQPIFIVLDDHTDMTLRPFVETQTRAGTGLEFRKSFGRNHTIESRLIYSNEGQRGDSLQGTVVDNIYEAQSCLAQGIPVEECDLFDRDRLGGFYVQEWSSDSDSEVEANFLADVHLVSDDLFLREIQDGDIGDPESRYTTSTAAASLGLGEWGLLSGRMEYNQSFETDDDIVLQRLPEVQLDLGKTMRPFGYNPLGLKLIGKTTVSSALFTRDTGYDGVRTDIAPSVTLPFHYKNYFASAFSVGVNQTFYRLDNQMLPDLSAEIDDSNSRTLPQINYTTQTTVEQVFDVADDSFLRTITGLGRENQDLILKRVKHEISPFVSYSYIPDTSQSENPFFDSFDRVRQRSLMTYGVSTSLLGRMLPRGGMEGDIPEMAPRIEDIPPVGVKEPIFDFGALDQGGVGFSSNRIGEIRELVELQVYQSWDYFEDSEDTDPLTRAFSDIGTSLSLYPGENFGLEFGSTYNPEDNQLSSWNVLSNFRSDRGDALRFRYTFIRDEKNPDTGTLARSPLSQIEGNLEFVVTDRVKVGWYSRYNDVGLEFNSDGAGFIENLLALRLRSACDCWSFDVGYSDTINPDKQTYLVRFTFGGLGDISQDVLTKRRNNSVQ